MRFVIERQVDPGSPPRVEAIRRSGRGLVAGGVWLLLVGLAVPALAQAPVSLSARVIRFTGKARCSSDGQTWRMLETGDVLLAGAMVQTAKKNSTVDIELGEAAPGAPEQKRAVNFVRLFDDSALAVKRLTATTTGPGRVENTELQLERGDVLGVIERLPGASEYNIQFPAGVAGIQGTVAGSQGTVYVLRSTGTLTVLAGKLVLAMADGRTAPQVVAAGQQFNPGTDQVTSLPADAPERKLWPSATTAVEAQPKPAAQPPQRKPGLDIPTMRKF